MDDPNPTQEKGMSIEPGVGLEFLHCSHIAGSCNPKRIILDATQTVSRVSANRCVPRGKLKFDLPKNNAGDTALVLRYSKVIRPISYTLPTVTGHGNKSVEN
jgi:hypothetical protein